MELSVLFDIHIKDTDQPTVTIDYQKYELLNLSYDYYHGNMRLKVTVTKPDNKQPVTYQVSCDNAES